ncbi:MAG: hypothetical protein WC876_03625 [Candidatus Thermoplasmatota archaeon]|jgi:hypothetical protein
MSDFTNLSTAVLSVVAAAAFGLAITMWIASNRLGQSKIRFVSAGFFVLVAKCLFTIYCIQTRILHHEVLEMIGGAFDMTMVLLMAAPFWMRR